MVIWLALFLILIVVSFILAISSMKDYQEIHSKNGVFLIRNPQILNESFFKNLLNRKIKQIVLEKLYKGEKIAFIANGLKEDLNSLGFDLLELEDYSRNLEGGEFKAWELGLNPKKKSQIFNPKLESGEQLWLQAIITLRKRDFALSSRVVLVASRERQKQLESLEQGPGPFVKIPKPLTSKQILKNYQNRSISTPPLLLGASHLQYLFGLWPSQG